MSIDDLPLDELVKRVPPASVGVAPDEDGVPLSELAIGITPASADSDGTPLEYLMGRIKPTCVVAHVCLDDVPLHSINNTVADLWWECLTRALLNGEDIWRQKLRQIACR